jgi:ketosteroid isomerase-like protein
MFKNEVNMCHKSNLCIAEAYYTAVGKKDISSVQEHIHPDVHLVSPLTEMRGKEGFLEAVKNLAGVFESLTIREVFEKGDQAVVIYDINFPAPINRSRCVALLSFQEGLITKFELFFDARPFQK